MSEELFYLEEFKKVNPLGSQYINFLDKYIFEEFKIKTEDRLRSLKIQAQK